MERGIWLTSVLSLDLVNAEAARNPRPEIAAVSRGLKPASFLMWSAPSSDPMVPSCAPRLGLHSFKGIRRSAWIGRDPHFATNSQKQNSMRYVIYEFCPFQFVAPRLLQR
jgi:hypothetical protein